MKDHRINFLVHRPVSISKKYYEHKFEPRKDCGWFWLQSLVFWFLRKIKAYAFDTTTIYQRFTIDTGKLVEQLFRQKAELMSHYNLDAERLLIGYDTYNDLMGEYYSLNLYHTINLEAPYLYGQKICGMKITIVPWMSGMCVLPKLED